MMIHVWQRRIKGHTQVYVVDDTGLDMTVIGSSLEDREWEAPEIPADASEDLLRALGLVEADAAVAETARAMFRIFTGEETAPEQVTTKSGIVLDVIPDESL